MEEKRNIDINYLFIISKAFMEFYETPVIFFTRKDFSDTIFNTYCTIRKAIVENAHNTVLIDAVTDFHLEWLRALGDIENFKDRMKDISREEVYETVNFTIKTLCIRRNNFQRYLEKYHPSLPNEEYDNMRAEQDIVEEMHKETIKAHLEQLKCFKDYSCNITFQWKLNEAVEELALWLDKICDKLVLEISEIINYKRPTLSGDLPRALQHIVNEFTNKKSESYWKIHELLEQKGKTLSSMVRGNTTHALEIEKVTQKIEDIDKQLKGLEKQQTSAIKALENKRDYLQDRITSLGNIKVSLKEFNDKRDVIFKSREEEETCVCEDFYYLRIFNHLLPLDERKMLVTELLNLWCLGILGQSSRKPKSLSSILSATEREIHTDELGTFSVDEYSRKIYWKPNDEIKYQKNEKCKLVPLSDDDDHIYFYDHCGRYFFDPTLKEKVYKAHETASEYMMGFDHCLMKTKEVKDGRTYYYDCFGRYYLDDVEGRRIYQEEDGASEYEPDSFGNLVRIRHHPKYYDTCPGGSRVTDEYRYLKRNVAVALRMCIANTVYIKPVDPIKYLATTLIKYRANEETQCERQRDREELQIERDIKAAEEKAERDRLALEASMKEMSVGSETSSDFNFISYNRIEE